MKKYTTDLGAGTIIFTIEGKECTVVESNDQYMSVGETFPLSDIATLNSEYEEYL